MLPSAVSTALMVSLSNYGTPKQNFAAQWLACALPCQRFATPSRVVDA